MIDRLTAPPPARLPAAAPPPRPAVFEAESRREIRCRLERDLAGRPFAYGPDGRRLVPSRAMFVATYC